MVIVPNKILMVEDDDSYFLLIQEMLSCSLANEFEVQRLDSLGNALDYLTRESADIVLLDLNLPDSQGIETFNRLSAGIPQTPIVILSGGEDVELAVEAVHGGAEDYLVKGQVNGDLLIRVLHYALARKKTREDLRSSEERYSLVIEQTGRVVYDCDLKTGDVTWLGMVEKITGYPRAEFREFNLVRWWDLIHPDDRPVVERMHRRRGAGSTHYALEYRIRRKDGAFVYVEENGTFVSINGCPARLLATLTEITSRKQFELDLRQHNEFLNQVIESLAHPFCVINVHTGERVLANSAARRVNFWQGIQCHPDRQGASGGGVHAFPVDEVKQSKAAFVAEHVHVGENGRTTHVEIHGYPVLDNHGDVAYLIEYGIDITERRQAERRLKEERDRAQTYLDTVGVMMVALDVNQEVTLINEKGCSVLGFTEAEVVGKKWAETFVSPHEQEMSRRYISDLLAGRSGTNSSERRIVTKNGEEKIIAWKTVILRDASGAIVGVLSSGEDITAQKKMHDELLKANAQLSEQEKKLRMLLEMHTVANDDLRQAKDQLIARQTELLAQKEKEERLRKDAEAATLAKSQFLTNMSHEVRTPLNSVIGFMTLLRRTTLTDKQRKYAENVIISGKYLLTIINDILEYEKVFSGRIVLEETEINLSSLIGELVTVLRGEHEKKPVVLDYHMAADIPATLWGDPVRLRQIIHNLLNNAYKFTPSGKIDVTVEKAVDLKAKDDFFPLRFSVADTGIGIPADKFSKIFEAFTQADDSVTRKYGGTGLGLTICAAYVQMMGGRIWVESEVGKGSRFIFEIQIRQTPPVSVTAAGAPVTVPADERHIVPEGIRILIADENEEARQGICAMAVPLGWVVDFVQDGQSALDKIRVGMYDICFLAVKMPLLSGIEVTHLVRQDGRSQLPLIALTDADFFKNREACLAVGMNDYLARPVSLEKFKERVIEYVAR